MIRITSPARLLRLLAACAVLGTAPLLAQAQNTPETWYLDNNMVQLDPSSRHVGSVIATNRSSAPIYVRTTVQRVTLRDSQRQRVDDDSGALLAYPAEFVLKPGASFTVRLVGDPARLKADSQSFYVHMADVSNVMLADEARAAGGVFGGFLLAYDALVNVSRQGAGPLPAEALALEVAPDQQLRLTNRSGRHVYIDRGSSCAGPAQRLSDCEPVKGFPVQSLLPGESIPVPAPRSATLGLLVSSGIDPRQSQATVVYLARPADRAL